MMSNNSNALIASDEGLAAQVDNADSGAALVLVCEHASSYIPASLGDLGLAQDARYSHIAWDIGAGELSIALSRLLDAPLVASCVSRLVYDCNRPLAESSATPSVSEIYDVPGNRSLSSEQRQQRYNDVYLPFESAVAQQISIQSGKQSAGRQNSKPAADASESCAWQLPVLVTVHSFTPVYHGQNRDVEIGLLHDDDSRFAMRMQQVAAELESDVPPQDRCRPFFKVDLNEPYSASDGVLHTLVTHARPANLAHVMIEVNNKLIRDADGVDAVAQQLASMITLAIQSGPGQ